MSLLAACQPLRHALHWSRLRVSTETRYLRGADVVAGTELDTGRYEVAQYSYFSDIPHHSDRWYERQVLVKAPRLAALPVGQPLAVPDAQLTVQGFGRATWYFEQFQAIGGTLTRLPAPANRLRLRFDLHYLDKQQRKQPLLRQTLVFRLDTGYFRQHRSDYQGRYDDLRLALKEPDKVRQLDLTNWAIGYEQRNGPDSGPDTLYQRLSELRNVEELRLKFSELRRLPPGFGKLKHLKKIDLSYNSLATFPAELYELDSLRELNLAWNSLDSIPPAIARLQSLRTLDLSDNRLRHYPEAVNELTELDSLSLGNASLRRLPPGIGRLHRLRMLTLDGFWNSPHRNQLADVEALSLLPQLRRLSLAGNRLETVPATVYQLPDLEELNLLDNGLDSAAVQVKRLPKLKKLKL